MNLCNKCLKKEFVYCNHIQTQCNIGFCMKKRFRGEFCTLHFIKENKSVYKNTFTDADEQNRLERIRLVREKARVQQNKINDKIYELKKNCNYDQPNILLHEYLEKVKEEQESQDFFLNREFEETMRFHQRKFINRENSRKQVDEDAKDELSDKIDNNLKKIFFSSVMIAYFIILNIEPTIDLSLIRTGYKKAAIKYHPDKNIGIDTTSQFQQLSLAYEKIVVFAEKNI